ncbi:hypothetical protein F66182_7715 [Fusarium sp. NRRL 66182]|nr:hypothetical protein F66182_7715 [Fusarium sp. NRRL 66182]
MRTTRHLTISIPIPGNLPPGAVVAGLQTITPFITHNRTITSVDEVLAAPEDTVDDPFFGPFDDSFRTFDCHEVISLAPGLSKTIGWKAIFQSVTDGVRSRALAPAGVTVRAEWTVRQQQRAPMGPISPAGSDSTASGSTVTQEGDEYELHEDVFLEANSLLMPFIVDSCLAVHRDMCENLLAGIFKDYFGPTPMK